MGIFSWIAQDSNRSVKVHYKNRRKNVYYLWDNEGNCWKEDEYWGYGVFNGKDYFVLLYEMNLPPECKLEMKEKIKELEKRDDVDDEDFNEIRQKGIKMYYSNDKTILFPNITESVNWDWINEKPKDCPKQGM